MVIVGIAGKKSSGKATLATMMAERYSYKTYDLKSESGPQRSPAQWLDYLTENWLENCIIYPLTAEHIRYFRKRPYFYLIIIDAPLKLRIQYSTLPAQSFLDQFGDDYDMHPVIVSGDCVVYNTEGPEVLWDKVPDLDKLDYRPTWDEYFKYLAQLAATRSNWVLARHGCVIVRDSKVIATGYNGPPSGHQNWASGGCELCVNGTGAWICIPSEINALVEVGRDQTQGAAIYCTHFPSLYCTKGLVQAGVSKVFYIESTEDNTAAESLFRTSNISINQI